MKPMKRNVSVSMGSSRWPGRPWVGSANRNRRVRQRTIAGTSISFRSTSLFQHDGGRAFHVVKTAEYSLKSPPMPHLCLHSSARNFMSLKKSNCGIDISNEEAQRKALSIKHLVILNKSVRNLVNLKSNNSK